MMYDAAIVGSGPAGLSAALNLKMRDKDVVWFGEGDLSAKVGNSERIANYPGLGVLSGEELNLHFKEHIGEMDLTLTERKVTNILPTDEGWQILAENEIFEARTLLLAIGSVSGKGFPGELELLGRGVSYCATCDGFFYRGKTIAVYCGDPRYESEVRYLADMAGTVFCYAPYGGGPFGQEEPDIPENVEILRSPIKSVEGDMRVRGVTLADGTELEVDGLFCLRDSVAPEVLLPGLALDGPHITVNRAMETNLRGCWAAGDCTGRPYQIAKAVGEGNVAAHSMLDYLAKEE